MASLPERPPKLSREEAARKMTDLILEHMNEAGMSVEEQERRIDDFSADVARLRSHATAAKRARTSVKKV